MTYLHISFKLIDYITINHDKRQDPMRQSPQVLCPKSSIPTVNALTCNLLRYQTIHHIFYLTFGLVSRPLPQDNDQTTPSTRDNDLSLHICFSRTHDNIKQEIS